MLISLIEVDPLLGEAGREICRCILRDHYPVGKQWYSDDGYCSTCSATRYGDDNVWPCPTVLAIMDVLERPIPLVLPEPDLKSTINDPYPRSCGCDEFSARDIDELIDHIAKVHGYPL
jgi:hypothetical protein